MTSHYPDRGQLESSIRLGRPGARIESWESTDRPEWRLSVHRLKSSIALALIAVVVLVGCSDADQPAATEAGNATDARFVNGMIPHHEGALEMAKLAKTRSERDEIKALSAAILKSQQAEIGQMVALQPLLPQNAGTMMSAEAVASMARETEALAIAPDFDREFIADMIPHHEGAITMSRRLQLDGSNEELRALSRSIVSAQSKEIAQMRRWYERWYGEPAPASKDGGHGGH